MSKYKFVFLYNFIFLFIFVNIFTIAYAEQTQPYVHEEAFQSDHNLKGLFSSCNENFYAGKWEIQSAKLTLYFTATELVREDISDYTVYINEQPIYSARIPKTYGQTQKAEIVIPADAIIEGINSVSITSYVRTNDEDACKDDISEASWMTVLKESSVGISYYPITQCNHIADFYKQFTSIEATENYESCIVIPNEPTETELTASALALSGIASNAVLDYENIALSTPEELFSKKYCIYICEYENILPEIDALLNDEQKEVARQNTLISFFKANGNHVLLITGAKDSIENAGRLIGNKLFMSQTKTLNKYIYPDEDVTFQAKELQQHNLLTETGSYFKGPFKQSKDFYIVSQLNEKVSAGSELTINFRYSENLDFTRSLVTVYVGDVPLGSKKLNKDSASADSLTVAIPNNLDLIGSFNITISFDLEIQDMVCSLRQQDMPWAYIANTSEVKLNTEEVSELLFEYYPNPFIKNGVMNQVAVVLPQQPNSFDLFAFKNIMLTLGRYQKENTGVIHVYKGRNKENLKNYNIISIGNLKNNQMAQEINDKLYFKFDDEKTTIVSNEKLSINKTYGSTLGTTQLLYSPYSNKKEYALMLVTGIHDTGVQLAAKYVGTEEGTWSIYGDGYVADSEAVFCYRFKEENAKNTPLSKKVFNQKDIVPFIVFGGSSLLLVIIAFVLLRLKYRKKE